MEQKKNLCAQIPISLHARVREEQEKAERPLSQYITELLTEYFTMKDNKENGGAIMGKTRTMAFQVSEEFFQRIKTYLNAHRGLSQRDFVTGLVEQALTQWEQEQTQAAEQHGHEELSAQDTQDSGDAQNDGQDLQNGEDAQDDGDTQDGENAQDSEDTQEYQNVW